MGTQFYELFGNKIKKFYDYVQEKVLNNSGGLAEEEKFKINEIVLNLDRYIYYCERLKLNFGRLLDYEHLKTQDFSLEEIENFYQDDCDYLSRVDELYINNLNKRNFMFGYPANMENYSYLAQYFRYLESKIYLMNNCGDPYQAGNYGMDSKDIERNIIDLIAQNLGLQGKKYWGYITSGGTESNFWGIREGFQRFPKGKLYFSSEAHYSVEKFVSNSKWSQIYPYTIIKANEDGTININALLEAIRKDKAVGYEGAILLLTWGTTCRGAIDSIGEITELLNKENIQYYCHVDAALYGGISVSQKNAPSLFGMNSIKVDSVSVSLHKFFGTARVNGVLLALNRNIRTIVDYIGQEDSTLLGSRDYLPFSTYQRVKELLQRKSDNYYCKNVEYFKKLLESKRIPYEVYGNGNIFVIDKPKEQICKKYQLATFTDPHGTEKAHIIIFPFHKMDIINELVEDLEVL